MFDFSIMYDANYSVLAGEATVALDTGDEFTIAYVSRLEGVEVFEGGEGSVATLKPAVIIRVSDLPEGVTRADLDGGVITVAEVDYNIQSTEPRPSPNGEALGELYLWLEEA